MKTLNTLHKRFTLFYARLTTSVYTPHFVFVNGKGPVLIYVEGGREKRRGGQGYFRLARGGGGAKLFSKEV